KGEESPSAARAGGGSALRALPSLPNPSPHPPPRRRGGGGAAQPRRGGVYPTVCPWTRNSPEAPCGTGTEPNHAPLRTLNCGRLPPLSSVCVALVTRYSPLNCSPSPSKLITRPARISGLPRVLPLPVSRLFSLGRSVLRISFGAVAGPVALIFSSPCSLPPARTSRLPSPG